MGESDACGVTRKRTANRGLLTPSRGIRVPWGVDQRLADFIRPILEVTPDGVASHVTAAHLWKIPLPAWLGGSFQIHISRDAPVSPPLRKGITGHHTRFKPGEISWVQGLAVTSPLRTWLDLASLLDLDDLVAAGDFLVCEHHRSFGPPRIALVTLADLKEGLRHEFRRRGLVKAREAAELIRVGADSPPETKLRLALQRAGLPEPILNYVVRDLNGQDCSWPDLALPEWKVALEYDGAHHRSVKQKGIDDARDHLMAQLGWRQVRISQGVLDAGGERAVVVRIREALRAQGGPGGQNKR